MPLEPPPEAFYGERQELITAVKEWASSHGYAATIKNSNNHKGFIYIACDCSGTKRTTPLLTPLAKRRRRGSRRDRCPFLVVGRRSAGIWGLTVRVGTHNHGPTRPDAHPTLRRLGPTQRELVSSLSDVGVRPRQLAAQLQQTRTTPTAIPLLPRDIYNVRHELALQQLAGRTPIQSLLANFAMDDFVSEHKLDTDNHVTHLFFASRQSLDLYHCYPEVLLLDCTYNTNKYGLPLLNVVGITGINSTFLVCCAFVKSEGEDDFHWVLQKLSSYVSLSPGVVVTDCDYALMNVLNHVFPTSALLLCRWHIRRSLLTHTKAHFSSCRTSERRRAGAAVLEDAGGVSAAAAENFMKDWDNIVFAVTVATYREKWRDLQRR